MIVANSDDSDASSTLIVTISDLGNIFAMRKGLRGYCRCGERKAQIIGRGKHL